MATRYSEVLKKLKAEIIDDIFNSLQEIKIKRDQKQITLRFGNLAQCTHSPENTIIGIVLTRSMKVMILCSDDWGIKNSVDIDDMTLEDLDYIFEELIIHHKNTQS